MSDNAAENEAAEVQAAEAEPLVTCWDCQEQVPESEIEKVSRNRDVCLHCREDHWVECDDCGELVANDDMTRTDNGHAVCQSCLDDHYSYSDTEGEWIHNNDCITAEDTEEVVSDSYAQRHWEMDDDGNWYANGLPNPAGLLDYNTNIFDVRDLPEPGHRLVFGVELEMEPRRGDARGQADVADALGADDPDFILKEDGSLHCGVELVTKPMTLEEHKDWRWADVLRGVQAIARSGEGTTNCGMHVHINKAALSPLVLGKLLVFLNADSTDELIRIIAQRSSNGYCQKDCKELNTGGKLWRRSSSSRYERLNVTRITCEVRIFRGNLRPERVLKNIEFCHAAIAFCRDASMQDVVVPSAFESFLLKHRSVYSNLVRFLNECKVPAFAGIVRETTKYKKPEVRAEV
jgi:hypothetical protein